MRVDGWTGARRARPPSQLRRHKLCFIIVRLHADIPRRFSRCLMLIEIPLDWTEVEFEAVSKSFLNFTMCEGIVWLYSWGSRRNCRRFLLRHADISCRGDSDAAKRWVAEEHAAEFRPSKTLGVGCRRFAPIGRCLTEHRTLSYCLGVAANGVGATELRPGDGTGVSTLSLRQKPFSFDFLSRLLCSKHSAKGEFYAVLKQKPTETLRWHNNALLRARGENDRRPWPT